MPSSHILWWRVVILGLKMTMTTVHHFSFHCRLFFCYTEFLEMHNTSCSHPPSLLTVLHSHPQVVITTKWPTILFGSSLEGSKRLWSFQSASWRSPTLLFVLSLLFCSALLFANPAASADLWNHACIWMQFLHHLVCHRWKCCLTNLWSLGEPRCSA